MTLGLTICPVGLLSTSTPAYNQPQRLVSAAVKAAFFCITAPPPRQVQDVIYAGLTPAFTCQPKTHEHRFDSVTREVGSTGLCV
ncbi:unnamed protein product [Protopolystoma xenopodis]|uniref:Uncharacterized protein n=1 Tax=Protopolystoma xenopodis TaxID=117903 RepID=A0A3S5ASA0_9PLAT|nr:unnamed protein product [Protopolystoma xenopodis]